MVPSKISNGEIDPSRTKAACSPLQISGGGSSTNFLRSGLGSWEDSGAVKGRAVDDEKMFPFFVTPTVYSEWPRDSASHTSATSVTLLQT
jgi:hypothetical protein